MVNDYLALSDAQLLQSVGAIFLPMLIALVMDSTWSDRVRYAVSLLAYVVYAFATLWFLNFVIFNADTTAHDVFKSFLLAAVIGYGSFKLVWQPKGATERLERHG